MKPICKWLGGKSWFVGLFSNLVAGTKYQTLVELFAGGAAISLAREEHSAVLNDVNLGLTATYRAIQRGEVIAQPMCTGKSHYQVIRERYNINKLKPFHPTLAEDFLFLNRFGFNGLYRENAIGEFNVPWNKKLEVPPRDLAPYQALLRNWTITTRSFDSLLFAPGDLIYADPPYDEGFSQYSRGGFGWEEQENLARLLVRSGCPVVATNLATDRIIKLYRDLGFTILTVEAPRRVAANGDRQPVLEMVATLRLG